MSLNNQIMQEEFCYVTGYCKLRMTVMDPHLLFITDKA